ncbi:MAG: hypothetical protein ACR2M0_10890 [Chloroflexia bacterium]
MQPDRSSNRSNTPARANTPARVTPLEQASRIPLLPTSRPARARRRTGPLNPVYLLLVTVVPLTILAVMVWAASGQYASLGKPQPGVVVVLTPAADVASRISLTYPKDTASQQRQGDIVTINGQAKNNSSAKLRGVYLKAFLYRPDAHGGQELVGNGVGSTGGELLPGAAAPFTVTAQLSGGPAPSKPGTPPVPPKDFQTVNVQVDQVWIDPTPTPAAK